jgi:hypothetical protein
LIPSRLDKIRAVAADERGDPRTRAIAQQMLRALEPAPKLKPDVVEGLKQPPHYIRRNYMDFGLWRKTEAGNPSYLVAHGGRAYKIVLFPHKKTPTWGWARFIDGEEPSFSKTRYASVEEAQLAAWNSLMSI